MKAVFSVKVLFDRLLNQNAFRGTKARQDIQKDAPRLLNLLRTELQREYERKHPVKEQKKQRARRNEPER